MAPYVRSSRNPAAAKSPSNASASRTFSERINWKLVASTKEYSLAEPGQRASLDVRGGVDDLDPFGTLEDVEEAHGGAVPRFATKVRPGLAPDMVRRDELLVGQAAQQVLGFNVMRVAAVPHRHPEGRVDEDHR
jgi:hypothetical protein